MAPRDSESEKSPMLDQEPYQAPTEGFMSYIPLSLLPVAQLIRLDKPGFVYFFVPMLCGALQAACLLQTSPARLAEAALKLLVLSIPITFINYSWNDTVDAEFDRQVWRTRHRPIARGAISATQAHAINLVLFALCYAALHMFSRETVLFSIPCALGSFVYPLSKRATMFPQVVFGFVMATGVLVGGSAVGLTPFVACQAGDSSFLACFQPTLDAKARSMLWMYAANVAWCICYEIVYSFQDVADDEQAGVGTITLLIRSRPKPLLWLLATLQTVLFVWTGVQSEAGPFYFLLSVGGMAVSMIVKLNRVDLQNPESCIWWFSRGALITGGAIATGLFGDYLWRIL